MPAPWQEPSFGLVAEHIPVTKHNNDKKFLHGLQNLSVEFGSNTSEFNLSKCLFVDISFRDSHLSLSDVDSVDSHFLRREAWIG